MTKSRILVIATSVAAVLGGLAAAQGATLPPPPPGNGPTSHFTQYGFFQGSATSNGRVGLFVATRLQGQTKFYYCSTPIDPNAKGQSNCRLIDLPPN